MAEFFPEYPDFFAYLRARNALASPLYDEARADYCRLYPASPSAQFFLAQEQWHDEYTSVAIKGKAPVAHPTLVKARRCIILKRTAASSRPRRLRQERPAH